MNERQIYSSLMTTPQNNIKFENELEKVFNMLSEDLLSPSRQFTGFFKASHTRFPIQSPGNMNSYNYGSPVMQNFNYSHLKSSTHLETNDRGLKFDMNRQITQDSCDFEQQMNISLPEIFFKMSPDLKVEQPSNDSILPICEERTQFSFRIFPINSKCASDLTIKPSFNNNCDFFEQLISENGVSKLKYLNKILLQVFLRSPVSVEEYSYLSPFEEELLYSILQRKFSKKLKLNESETDIMKRVDLVNNIITNKSHKRPEECYKFVLTRVIKYLQKCLVKILPPGARDSESFFYDYYFGEVAQSTGKSIADFYYPLTGKKEPFKLNSKYFQRIFKSPLFVSNMLLYLKENLEHDYQVEIGKKIESLLFKWDVLMQNSGPDSQSVEKTVKEYLIKNRKCKLPWTIYEVRESIEKFQNLVRNLDTNCQY